MEKKESPKKALTFQEEQKLIQKNYSLQYNKDHVVERVEEKDTDLVEFVNSRVNEVGLQNAIRYAIAHGEDPNIIYAKTTPGVGLAVDANMTKDELDQIITSNNDKFAEIAKSLGVTVEALQNALKTPGEFEKLITASQTPKEVVKEGE